MPNFRVWKSKKYIWSKCSYALDKENYWLFHDYFLIRFQFFINPISLICLFVMHNLIPAKLFPTSGIEEMALRKKKTDEPKYATKNKRTRYSKNGVTFPANDSPARK